jgi:predicted DsbA family dithiol-disulfide isomerase
VTTPAATSAPATTPAATATPAPAARPAPHLDVEVWSDVACPWCYIGKRRFGAALERFEHRDAVTVTWRSFELAPDAPGGPGVPELEALARRKGIPEPTVRQMFAQVTQVAAGEGLAYDFDRTLAVNTFDPHRLVHVAREHGGPALAERMLETLFSAHFERGADLGDPGTLVRLAGEAGLGEPGLDGRAGLGDDAVRELLAGHHAADGVRRDEAEARELGVTGVPFFVVDRRVAVSGAQPVELFGELLRVGWREAQGGPTVLGAAGPTGDDACADNACAV